MSVVGDVVSVSDFAVSLGKSGVRFGVMPNLMPKRGIYTDRPSNYLAKSLILFGSPGRIRTSDQPVNSRLLYR